MKVNYADCVYKGAAQCSNNISTKTTTLGSQLPNRPLFKDSAVLPRRLASITLTRDHLKQLDTLFADPEQIEQFRKVISGCLVRINRHVVGQKNDVIAKITGVVKPMQTQQLSLPNRRIFIINLGYFLFDQVVQQMPNPADYGAWIADMEMQSFPLPSDLFLREKALVLKDLLSRAVDNFAEMSFADEGATKVEKEEEEELMDGREEEQSGGGGQDKDGQGEEEVAADERANRQGIMSSPASAEEMLAISSSGAMKQEADSSDTECELDNEDAADNKEAEADQNYGTTLEYSSMTGMVATYQHLRAVRVPLFMVRLLTEHDAGGCLRGCLVVCVVKGDKKVIVDEIDQVTAAGGIRFKHSRKSHLIKDLQNRAPSSKSFDQWIEKLAKWDEPLPLMAAYKERFEKVYKICKLVARQLDWGQDSRLILESKFRGEMKSIRRLEEKAEQQANEIDEENLRQTYQKLRLRTDNHSSSSSSSNDELTDATGELSLNELVHTRELLDRVCLSNELFQTVVRYPALRHFLSGCFIKCRNRSTNETIIDVIAGVNPIEIRFKHTQKPFLLEELCILDESVSTEQFIKWIEDMTRWEEPLPSIRVCEQHKKRALRALQKTKQFDPEQQICASILNKQQARKATKRRAKQQFKEVFGKYTERIIVDPRQLVQLHQLGPAEFKRITPGLFVRVQYSIDNSNAMSLEQIRTVSFDHPAYRMYGQHLNVRLHFERPTATPVPVLDVQFDNDDISGQKLIEQHTKMVGNFVPPSHEFVLVKKEQLRCGLSKTLNIVGKPNPAW